MKKFQKKIDEVYLSLQRSLRLISDALAGKEHDYTSGSIRSAVLLLAIPMMLEMAMESIFAITDIYFVSGGMLEVQPNVVTVLADTAVRADDVDEAAAIEAQEKARQELANQSGEIDYSTAAAELAEAAARLRTIQQIRKKLGN